MWCGGGLRSIKPPLKSDRDYFKILDERDRTLYFSMVGYEPSEARIALVGLNPADSQLTEFIKWYMRTGDFDKSRKESAFSNQNLRGNLIKMLDFLRVPHFLGLTSASNLFSEQGRNKALMTSLVKCASLDIYDSQKSKHWDIPKYAFAVECARNRLLYDLSLPKDLGIIFILGEKAKKALIQITKNGVSLLDQMEKTLAPVIELPHPSGSNNENVLIFTGAKEKCDVRQPVRYQNCVNLRNQAINKIKEAFR